MASVLACTATLLGAGSAEAASAIQFRRIQYDSPGKDTGSNTSLNAEYFTLQNTGSKKRNLKNYTVRDKTGYTYTFTSDFYLASGASVRVHSGKGTNTSKHRYWGRSWYVWNNTGDKAYLRNSAGTTIDTCSWSSTGDGYTNC